MLKRSMIKITTAAITIKRNLRLPQRVPVVGLITLSIIRNILATYPRQINQKRVAAMDAVVMAETHEKRIVAAKTEAVEANKDHPTIR